MKIKTLAILSLFFYDFLSETSHFAYCADMSIQFLFYFFRVQTVLIRINEFSLNYFEVEITVNSPAIKEEFYRLIKETFDSRQKPRQSPTADKRSADQTAAITRIQKKPSQNTSEFLRLLFRCANETNLSEFASFVIPMNFN
jgi:hypothetical protein